MNREDIYRELDAEGPVSDKKTQLRNFLQGQIEYYQSHDDEAEMIAYSIAGLLATRTISTLPENDPYVQVLDMAAQLELPLEHRDEDASWPRLTELISQLPA